MESIILYVIICSIGLFCIYLLIKELNTSKRIGKLTEFVHGDIFSDRFHHVLANYFLDENNVRYLLDPIAPMLQSMINNSSMMKSKDLSHSQKINPPKKKNLALNSNLVTLSSGIHLFV